MKRFFAFFALIAVVLLIQTAVLSNWYALPVVPDILLLAVLYIGFHNGSATGEVSGFCSGLLLDFLSASPLGLNAMVRTIMGFFWGLLYRNVETGGIAIPAVLGFTATIAKALIIRFISFFYPGSVLTYSLFSPVFWYECTLNALCAPILFWVLSFFTILSKDFSTENMQ